MRVIVAIASLTMLVACGLTSPPLTSTARNRIEASDSATAWRLEQSSSGFERTGTPVVLDAATVARARALLASPSTYGGHRVKCIFQPVVELELHGPRGDVRVRLCFACDEILLDTADGTQEWARFVPGRSRLRALVDGLFPGVVDES
jgi:hypothetical protein